MMTYHFHELSVAPKVWHKILCGRCHCHLELMPFEVQGAPKLTRWWFQTFFIFTPIRGRFPY